MQEFPVSPQCLMHAMGKKGGVTYLKIRVYGRRIDMQSKFSKLDEALVANLSRMTYIKSKV